MITDLFNSPPPMRALTWKQPFANLMLHGKVETRTWATDYRGLVMICAAQEPYDMADIHRISGTEQHSRVIEQDGTGPWVTGMAIAVGELVGCHAHRKEDEDATFVGHLRGFRLYCHIYRNVRPIKPFPWKGKQGWSTVPQEVIEGIVYLDGEAKAQ
jgi:hypothetical protein